MNVRIVLPFPPSVNNYYKYAARQRRLYLSKKVGVFRAHVLDALKEQVPGIIFKESIEVRVGIFMPDKRKRDLDNYMKGLLDALTHGGLWEDDSLIDYLEISRLGVCKLGRIIVDVQHTSET